MPVHARRVKRGIIKKHLKRMIGLLTCPFNIRRLHFRSSGDVSLGYHGVLHVRAAEEVHKRRQNGTDHGAGGGVTRQRENRWLRKRRKPFWYFRDSRGEECRKQVTVTTVSATQISPGFWGKGRAIRERLLEYCMLSYSSKPDIIALGAFVGATPGPRVDNSSACRC